MRDREPIRAREVMRLGGIVEKRAWNNFIRLAGEHGVKTDEEFENAVEADRQITELLAQGGEILFRDNEGNVTDITDQLHYLRPKESSAPEPEKPLVIH